MGLPDRLSKTEEMKEIRTIWDCIDLYTPAFQTTA